MIRVSARAIIIENDKVLVFHRLRKKWMSNEWLEYYTFPGGGVESGETLKEAAKRELLEEMGVHIRVEREIAIVTGKHTQHHFFLGHIEDGEPAFNHQSPEALRGGSFNKYEVRWLDVATLNPNDFKFGYQFVAELIKDPSKLSDSSKVPEFETKE